MSRCIMKIIKSTGEKVPFKKVHIEKSLSDAGATRNFAREIAREVSKKVRPGMNTEEILDITLEKIKSDPGLYAKYDLKRAIMNLGPHGFLFEEYLAQILQEYGYKTKVGVKLKGKVVIQEVDILASKSKKNHMIEAKYHNTQGIYTDTKVAMYTHARFLDISSNHENKIDREWLITNTNFTRGAIQYSSGVNLKMISWKYPLGGSLRELINKKNLYPVTIFKCISNPMKEKLFRARIVLAKDLENADLTKLSKRTGLKKETLNNVLGELHGICRV